MALPVHPSLVVSLGIAAVVVWRLYARLRRMVGRQKMAHTQTWIRIVFFSLLIAVLLFASLLKPMHLAALLGGALAGAALGWYGIRLTRFEQTVEGLFYTPNLHLGIALSALLIGRLVYRSVLLYSASASSSVLVSAAVPRTFPSAQLAGSPLTLLIFGLLIGYYLAYAIGLLRWVRGLGISAQKTYR